MQHRIYKHTISLFLLAIFLFLKVADAHAFTHSYDEDEQAHCEFCQVISETKDQTYFLGNTTSFLNNESNIFTVEITIDFGYNVPLFSIASPAFFHNKPPPIFADMRCTTC